MQSSLFSTLCLHFRSPSFALEIHECLGFNLHEILFSHKPCNDHGVGRINPSKALTKRSCDGFPIHFIPNVHACARNGTQIHAALQGPQCAIDLVDRKVRLRDNIAHTDASP